MYNLKKMMNFWNNGDFRKDQKWFEWFPEELTIINRNFVVYQHVIFRIFTTGITLAQENSGIQGLQSDLFEFAGA